MARSPSGVGHFHRGSSGSPFHTEYYADQGAETGPGGQPSERGPRVGPGTLGKRVLQEWNRGARGGTSAGRRDSGDGED